MFLLDTGILYALRRRDRHPEVVAWLEGQRTVDLHLSLVTIGEIERGITQQQRRDPAFARDLVRWLDRVLALYGDRILSVDLPTARRWGQLSATLGHAGADLHVAATALSTGWWWSPATSGTSSLLACKCSTLSSAMGRHRRDRRELNLDSDRRKSDAR